MYYGVHVWMTSGYLTQLNFVDFGVPVRSIGCLYLAGLHTLSSFSLPYFPRQLRRLVKLGPPEKQGVQGYDNKVRY